MKIYKNQKKYFLFIFTFILFFIILLFFNSNVFAGLFDGTPTLITKLIDVFGTIKSWLLTLSTPAAAVAVGVGVFMKKFSFGDEERVRVAKKLIRGSLFSYAFILALDLILSAIQSLLA